MTSAQDMLRSAVESGRPCVLLLGQGASAADANSVLARLLRRKGVEAEQGGGWRRALDAQLTPSDFEWVTERFERTVIPESEQEALDLPWSAVFTSSIDPRVLHRLETRGRQPEAIVASDQRPRAPRSTARPPIYYLFGRSSDTADGVRCPGSPNELSRRAARHASVLLARIPETVTSAGLLVVNGYQSSSDWLAVDALLSAIPPGEGMKILWFGVDEGVQASGLFVDLEKSGSLLVVPKTLGEAVAEMKATGDFSPRALPVLHEPGVISFGKAESIEISPSLRLRVEASASIVDDDWTKPPDPLSPVAEEDWFQRTHGDPGGPRFLVEGVARGFFLQRDFEKELLNLVTMALGKASARDRVIILHGQSGTGKTVAFARLALEARRELSVPVLIAAGRVPEPGDADAFCEEIERSGYGPTLILCDANESFGRYLPLADALRSRGRKFLLIGTSYRQENITHRGLSFVQAPDTASEAERNELGALVGRFVPLVGRGDSTKVEGDHVFALLYRTISAGRPRLASGLGSEARFVESAIRARVNRPRAAPATTQLAQQLIAAGLHTGEQALFERIGGAVDDHDTAGRLIDHVMVAGRVDVGVPLNLLMRALRSRDTKLDFDLIAELFEGLDLFRWAYGNQEKTELLVCARLRLEAELVCRRRLASSDREIECLTEMIEAVRPSGVDEDSELRFLRDLLQKLGRDGPRGAAYAEGYRKIGDALTTLRVKHGVEDAALMLQESNFRRAWLWSHVNEASVSIIERDLILDQARAVVEEAVAKIESKQLHAGKHTKENLLVERASIYGFLAVGHARNRVSPDVIWSDYIAARVAARRAMNIPSYIPFDVALWMPANILEADTDLSFAQRAELHADIYATLDRIDSQDVGLGQLARYNKRRNKVGRALGDATLEQTALQDLERVNPQAAAFLGARNLCPELFECEEEPVPASVRAAARLAADYLREHGAMASQDSRCLRSLLEYEWAVATGLRLFRGARRPLPSSRAVLEELQRIAAALLAASGDAPEALVRYLHAVLSWALGNHRDAEQSSKTLSRDTEYEDRRRVIRRLVMADADGRPTRYKGRLVEARTKGHWLVELEGTRVKVDLLERDFAGQALRTGGEVRDFWVAFNYLGAIADKPSSPEAPR